MELIDASEYYISESVTSVWSSRSTFLTENLHFNCALGISNGIKLLNWWSASSTVMIDLIVSFTDFLADSFLKFRLPVAVDHKEKDRKW